LACSSMVERGGGCEGWVAHAVAPRPARRLHERSLAGKGGRMSRGCRGVRLAGMVAGG